uniref:Secreted protein n=1 Tax=Xenopus tropicalis TaxID=8364 RepID=A0A1B8XX09_XENTR
MLLLLPLLLGMLLLLPLLLIRPSYSVRPSWFNTQANTFSIGKPVSRPDRQIHREHQVPLAHVYIAPRYSHDCVKAWPNCTLNCCITSPRRTEGHC